MNFIIPTSFDALRNRPSDNRFWVSEFEEVHLLPPPSQIDKLTLVREAFFGNKLGPLQLPYQFSTLYNFIANVPNLGKDVQKQLSSLMTNWIQMFSNLSDDQNEGLKYDCLKMYLVLFTEWLSRAPDFNMTSVQKAVRKLVAYDILQLLKLRQPEKQFIRLMMDIMFPLIQQGKSPEELVAWLQGMENINDLWTSWGARVVKMLMSNQKKDTDVLISTVIQIIRGRESLAKALVEEVVGTMEKTESMKGDSDPMRTIGKFIEDLCGEYPNVFISELAQLVTLLNCDAYIVRNGVVSAVKSYLIYLLGDECVCEIGTKSERISRLFDILEQRTFDKAAFARQKALDALCELVEKELIPIDRFVAALRIAKERLMDTHAIVRKSAGKLLFMIVGKNKIADMRRDEFMSVEELKTRLEGIKTEEIALSVVENTENVQNDRAHLHIEQDQVKQYLDMVNDLTTCTTMLYKLLDSKTITDVVTAVEVLFLLQARGLQAADKATKRIIPLIWKEDEKLRKIVAHGFHGIYTNKDLQSPSEGLVSLIQLYTELTPGEKSTLEGVLKSLWTHKLLDNSYLSFLKTAFEGSPSSALACFLRCACFPENDSFASYFERFAAIALRVPENLQVLEEVIKTAIVLGAHGEKTEIFLGRASFILTDLNQPFTFPWFGCVQELINAISSLSADPLTMLKTILTKVITPLITGNKEQDLAKCLFLAGEIGLKVMVLIEKDKTILQRQRQDSGGQEQEMDQISGIHAAEFYDKLEKLNEIQERNVVFTNLLCHFPPLIGRCMQVFPTLHPFTQQAVVLALGKFMCVSRQYCESNLSDLLILQSNPMLIAPLRCNLVIIFGDLLQRFPNMIEPHVDLLFRKLRDEDAEVRRKAMLVVTHLVLNDMIKMKGQAAEVFLKLLDPDAVIRNLANLFLEELSKKSKATAFNAIPEALSRLSEDQSLSKEDFKDVSDWVLSRIETDRQQESLIERLSQKMFNQDGPAKMRLGYCMAKATKSEKAIRKLLDTLPIWQSMVLENQEIKDWFLSALATARKGSSSESSAVFDEFSTRLNCPVSYLPHKTPKGKKPS